MLYVFFWVIPRGIAQKKTYNSFIFLGLIDFLTGAGNDK
jgi:hypothetical protein